MRTVAFKFALTFVVIAQSIFCSSLKADDSILEMLPKDCLVCVKVNNLDKSLQALDQYMMGASPMPMGMSMMLKMQIGVLAGNPMLNGINSQGDFGLFIAKNDVAFNQAEPWKSIFIAGVIPVSDYDSYLASIPNLKKSDKSGISILPSNPASDMPAMIVKKIGGNIVITNAESIDSLAKFEPSAKANSLLKKLTAEQLEQCKKNKFWMYANVDNLNKTFGTLINSGFEDIKNEMKLIPGQMPESMPMINGYFDIIKDGLDQLDIAVIAQDVTPENYFVNCSLWAKSGSDLAKELVASEKTNSGRDITGIFRSDSFMNFAGNAKSPALVGWNEEWMNILSDSDPELKKTYEDIAEQFLKNADGYLAGTMQLKPGSKSFVDYRVIGQINNKEEYEKFMKSVLETSEQLFAKGAYSDFGFKWTMDEKPLKYNGSDIYTARIEFAVTNADMESAAGKMFEDGLKCSWAVTDKYYVAAMSEDSVDQTKKMLDDIKAGKAFATEDANIKKALDLIPESRNADVFGTYNMASAIKFSMMMNPMIKDKSLIESFQATSSIPYACKFSNGSASLDLVVPKKSMEEMTQISMAMAMMMQQNMQQGVNAPDFSGMDMEDEDIDSNDQNDFVF